VMLKIHIEVPTPSRFVKHDVIDDIALACNKAYREQVKDNAGHPVDVEQLIDLLGVSFLCEDVEEPDGTLFLARYTPPPEERITVNALHLDLFNDKPYVYASAVGHEIGHKVLKHAEHSEMGAAGATLFSEDTPKPLYLHKSSWGQYGLTKEEVVERKAAVLELAKRAMVSSEARQVIEQMQCVYEPEWMFWQAEQFSRCLLIPKDRLLEQLENSWDLSGWRDIYRLAEVFGVSGPTMKTRLEKLSVIKIGEDGNPHPVRLYRQGGLFN
jgi:hypothetical protein